MIKRNCTFLTITSSQPEGRIITITKRNRTNNLWEKCSKNASYKYVKCGENENFAKKS